MPRPSRSQSAATRRVASGADVLAASGFAELAGKRIGPHHQPDRLGRRGHLADLLSKAAGVKLTAILAPEHGFRGARRGRQQGRRRGRSTIGVPVFSLYGASKKPTPAMLRDVDVLVFDIQDIGMRFYTYISTMGLAMQAAAAARIPFIVLDRPNPLGGEYVSGFVLEPKLASFVGQYPIPIVHGMTVGELARMIQGEKLLPRSGKPRSAASSRCRAGSGPCAGRRPSAPGSQPAPTSRPSTPRSSIPAWAWSASWRSTRDAARRRRSRWSGRHGSTRHASSARSTRSGCPA